MWDCRQPTGPIAAAVFLFSFYKRIQRGLASGCRGCQRARASDAPGGFSRPDPNQGSSGECSGRTWCFPGWPVRTGSKKLPLLTSSWTEGEKVVVVIIITTHYVLMSAYPPVLALCNLSFNKQYGTKKKFFRILYFELHKNACVIPWCHQFL